MLYSKKKLALALSLFVFLFYQSPELHARVIHAILVCDTKAIHISDSVQKDFSQIQSFLKEIGDKTHLKIDQHYFLAPNITENISDQIEKISSNSDDIVFFFFSGHGYRTPSKGANQWPYLFLTPLQRGLDYQEIIDILKRKKAQLMFSMADCCNNIIPDKLAPLPMKKQIHYKGGKQSWIEQNYRKLFLETKGSIVISSSIPGDYAWGTAIGGGIYTQEFIKIFNEQVKKSEPADWEVILSQSSLRVHMKKLGQTPQYEIKVSSS